MRRRNSERPNSTLITQAGSKILFAVTGPCAFWRSGSSSELDNDLVIKCERRGRRRTRRERKRGKETKCKKGRKSE